jgi:diaminopimelate decarboxylase
MPPRELPDPTRFTPFFSYRAGQLRCEGVPVAAIARAVGTPAYVYSRASIASAYRRLDRSLGRLPHTLCYAVKANSSLAVLRLLARCGSSFDVVSGGELDRLARVGVPGGRIVFSGVGKTREEIRAALRAGIALFNVESAGELDLLASVAGSFRSPAPAAIRVNPDVEAGGHPHIATGHRRHKFGVDWAEARRLYLAERRARWIAWRGISAHIGSQILRLGPFRLALARLADHYRELSRAGLALRYLDFGGGLGVRYAGESPPNLARYARAVASLVRPLGCRLLLEPGRILVGPAGVLLTRVLYTKRNRGKLFVVVDAGMNDFIRPALYGAVHPVTAAEKRRNAPVRRADIVGPVCETGDRFLENWPVGECEPGDLLVLWGAGAYGLVAASNYNSRPRPCEVFVEGSRFRLTRRRESYSDLVRCETGR